MRIVPGEPPGLLRSMDTSDEYTIPLATKLRLFGAGLGTYGASAGANGVNGDITSLALRAGRVPAFIPSLAKNQLPTLAGAGNRCQMGCQMVSDLYSG